MTEKTKTLGKKGEDIAAAFLEKKGYNILFRNYKCSFGEIDIIAKHKKILSFIEVKTRSTKKYGLPQEAVTSVKQTKISRVALEFVQRYKMDNRAARFDVVSVQSLNDGYEVDLIENAFELTVD
jgi:putative endonuclease